MSGLGFLLLIPIMIIIPVFIAVETQSSELPTKMITSDTSYRTFQDVKTSIKNEVFAFGSNIDDVTFNANQSGKIREQHYSVVYKYCCK